MDELKLPARILLRCKKTGVLKGRHADIAECFDLVGSTDDHGLELWRGDGKWRDDGQPHALDIVGIQANGKFIPFDPK